MGENKSCMIAKEYFLTAHTTGGDKTNHISQICIPVCSVHEHGVDLDLELRVDLVHIPDLLLLQLHAQNSLNTVTQHFRSNVSRDFHVKVKLSSYV